MKSDDFIILYIFHELDNKNVVKDDCDLMIHSKNSN